MAAGQWWVEGSSSSPVPIVIEAPLPGGAPGESRYRYARVTADLGRGLGDLWPSAAVVDRDEIAPGAIDRIHSRSVSSATLP